MKTKYLILGHHLASSQYLVSMDSFLVLQCLIHLLQGGAKQLDGMLTQWTIISTLSNPGQAQSKYGWFQGAVIEIQPLHCQSPIAAIYAHTPGAWGSLDLGGKVQVPEKSCQMSNYPSNTTMSNIDLKSSLLVPTRAMDCVSKAVELR